MSKTKITLEQIEGVIDPANPPVDQTDNAGKIIVCDDDGLLPDEVLDGVDGSKLINTHWTLISSEAIGSTNTIPSGTNFIIINFRVYSNEGSSVRENTYGQFILIPTVLTSARVSSGQPDSAASIGLGSSITDSTITNTLYDVSSGGGRIAYLTGTVYYFK